MYSPKISEDLVPKLYHKAKAKGIAMTKLVNELLTESLKDEIEEDKCAEHLDVYSTDLKLFEKAV